MSYDYEGARKIGGKKQKKPERTAKPKPAKIMEAPANIDVALDFIVEELLPGAKTLAEATGRATGACMASILGKMVKLRVDPKNETKLKSATDNRSRKWEVQLTFTDENGAESKEIATTDPEILVGLNEVFEAIREYAEDVHGVDALREVPQFSKATVTRQQAGVHSAVSLGDGSTVKYIEYTLEDGNEFMCKVNIARC